MQIGLRGTLWDGNDFAYAVDSGMRVITYDEYDAMGRDAAIAEIRRVVGDGPTYVTYDIDGLDPTHAPGTAVLEPGGFSMRDSQVILRGLTGLNVVGGDVSEVSPPLDVGTHHGHERGEPAVRDPVPDGSCALIHAHASAHAPLAGSMCSMWPQPGSST